MGDRRPRAVGGTSLRIPPGVDWMVHRVAVSSHYRDSLSEILHTWTLSDLADAHLMLDELEYAESQANKE